MARPDLRLPENVGDDFFVDDTCIDCDTCRQIAPATFRDHGGQSSVYRQPETATERRLARMAAVACPTASIGALKSGPLHEGVEAFPQPVVGDEVFFCGFTAEESFGAWSWLLVRPAERGGNVLVDSPRFAAPLVSRVRALGGVRTLFLTHRDDVADHAAFAREFGCRRILHAEDGAARLGVEDVIEGRDPVRLDEELTILPTPGHTEGHMVLLWNERVLFSGDHLSWSPEAGRLTAFRDALWYSWAEQIRSMERLAAYRFEWVLPGHGRVLHAPAGEMRGHLDACIRWMRTIPGRRGETVR